MGQKAGEHHGRAAYHTESATRHHRAAELAYGSGDHKKAALEARMARGHSVQATHHAEQAEKHHIERFGMPSEPDIPASPVKE